MELCDVLALRLRIQRITSAPAPDPASAVTELLCVQAQDARLAAAMVAHRAGTTASQVWAAIGDGAIVRTHLLRPTWHFVAAADLRWVLRLTSARVESSMTGRHRQLSLDAGAIERGFAAITGRIGSGHYAPRPAIQLALLQAGVLEPGPLLGQQVGHLLALAELRGLVCSAPVPEQTHHYALLDEVIPPSAPLTRAEAVVALVSRFVVSHGPVSVRDLQRWTPLPQREVRPALLESGATRVEVDGAEMWWEPSAQRPATRPSPALLLSVFDEAFLTYRDAGFRTTPGNPVNTERRFAESGGGPVICDLTDVGTWKRLKGKGTRIDLDPATTPEQHQQVEAARQHLEGLLA